MTDLVERLRNDARGYSQASKMMADAKSERNNLAEGRTDCEYDYIRPEQTTAWKAADRLIAQDAEIAAKDAEIERLRALQPPALPVAWQSMDCAPKDGTPVIVALADGMVGEAYFDGPDENSGGWWWANTNWGDYTGAPIIPEPVKWMPLPSPEAAPALEAQGVASDPGDASYAGFQSWWTAGQYEKVGSRRVVLAHMAWFAGTQWQAATPTVDAGTVGVIETTTEYEVWQDEMVVASSTDLADAQHYAFVYGQDGPVELIEAKTVRRSLSAPAKSAQP